MIIFFFCKTVRMKNNWLGTLLAICMLPADHRPENEMILPRDLPPVQHLFIITIDGCRWQEIFTGADKTLLHDETFTPDTATLELLYDAATPEERRKKLLPFFWNVICTRGKLFGNRSYGNKVDMANPYAISYPGYNEIFTGTTDESVNSNDKTFNSHVNILEYLNDKPGFRDSIAAFTSWDLFPFILNRPRSHLLLNSGYEELPAETESETLLDTVQSASFVKGSHTRQDGLTFLAATNYLEIHHPRVLYMGLGETDEYAHKGRYDLYLDKLHEADRMIGELWHWVQTTPGYKNQTTFIITTDHGRGRKTKKWISHNNFIKGSSETWLALIGPNFKPAGEVKTADQIYAVQFAGLMTKLLGVEFLVDN